METLLGLFASPALGGLFGFVGSYFTKREERLTLEITLAHNEKMATITADNKRKEISLSGEMKENEIDANSFLASQRYGNKGDGFGQGLLSAMRPVIAIYLISICTYIGYELNRLVGGLEVLPAQELLSMYKDLIMSFMTLLTLSVSWFYGSRASAPPRHLRK
jgi:hypothetical protein